MSRTFNHSIIRIKNSEGKFDALSALRGENSYELAVKYGFQGTEDEWMESIMGDGWMGAYYELQDSFTKLDAEFDALDAVVKETVEGLDATKALAFENIIVPDWAWEESDDLPVYPYRAAISLPDSGVDASYFVDVVFNQISRDKAELSQDAKSYDGGFYIYASSIPEVLVTINTAECIPSRIIQLISEVFGVINVTYAAGKTVTCTDGTRTLTAKTTSGSWQFAVPNAGEWIISDGENSQTVSITTQGQTRSVNFTSPDDGRLWLIKKGAINTELTFPTYVTKTQNTESVKFEIASLKNAMLATDETYDFSNYDKLVLEINGGYSYYNANKAPLLCVGKSKPAYPDGDNVTSLVNADKFAMLATATGNIPGGTYELDTSELSGAHYIAIGYSKPSGKNAYIDIVNLWLE